MNYLFKHELITEQEKEREREREPLVAGLFPRRHRCAFRMAFRIYLSLFLLPR